MSPPEIAQISWLKAIVTLGVIAGLVLSPRLWLSSRACRLVPVWDFLQPLPPPFDYLVLVIMLGLLLWIAVASRPAIPVAAFLAIAIGYAMSDQSRWQPWFYQYLFMLAALSRRDSSLDICRLIVAAVYFWSGAHKINPEFARDTLPWMLGSLPEHLPAFVRACIPILGFAAPIAEMAIAVGLLTMRFRRAAVIGALVMHAFIMISIGVLHRYYDVIVWPWNVAMCVFVVLLFWNHGKRVTVGRTWFPRLVLLLFGIAPALRLVNLGDAYPSFALHSGNNNTATIYMADAVADRLPPAMQEFVTVNDSLVDELDLFEWSFGELNVPPYAEVRIFKKVGKRVCAAAGNPKEMVLVVLGHRRQKAYDCAALSR